MCWDFSNINKLSPDFELTSRTDLDHLPQHVGSRTCCAIFGCAALCALRRTWFVSFVHIFATAAAWLWRGRCLRRRRRRRWTSWLGNFFSCCACAQLAFYRWRLRICAHTILEILRFLRFFACSFLRFGSIVDVDLFLFIPHTRTHSEILANMWSGNNRKSKQQKLEQAHSKNTKIRRKQTKRKKKWTTTKKIYYV